MSQSEHNGRIDYVEFMASDLDATRRFYEQVFGWRFKDWGPDYTSFKDGRLNGGFRRVDDVPRGGTLAVIYAVDLGAIQARVREAGAEIVVETFEFPGGRRFHFTDPNGNELAVWSDR